MMPDMDISYLKNLLKKRGLTQTDLAHLLGRDKAVVTNLLQGKRTLKAEEAVIIARHLNIDVAQLLGEKSASRNQAVAEHDTLIPFQSPPSAKGRRSAQVVEKNGRHYLQDALPANSKRYALEVRDDSLNLLGILPGDVVISELDAPCKAGQIVVVQHYKGANAETILRQYEPPFLTSHSTQPGYKPLHEKHDQVRLVSPILKLIRLL